VIESLSKSSIAKNTKRSRNASKSRNVRRLSEGDMSQTPEEKMTQGEFEREYLGKFEKVNPVPMTAGEALQRAADCVTDKRATAVIQSYGDERARAEREACCKELCFGCQMETPLVERTHVHPIGGQFRCDAWPLRARSSAKETK
jgi:hypothetical protein